MYILLGAFHFRGEQGATGSWNLANRRGIFNVYANTCNIFVPENDHPFQSSNEIILGNDIKKFSKTIIYFLSKMIY